ncbi:hypothetical protein [Niveispirillum irakense]|uniref:hypothetical protein n=1 Tax=Niveispirillum irakense TaxID=34011 RepID=UPI00040F75E1|nr:hypothetical protein [Niveispirillum irakense]
MAISSAASLFSSNTTTSRSSAADVLMAEQAVKQQQKLRELEKIADEVTSYSAQKEKLDKKAAAQANIQVQTFEKQVRKSPYATTSTATDIGTLVKDTTRLNVYSNLKKGDNGDVFRFKTQGSGEIQLNTVADPGLRVQVVTRFGGVVADSAATVGKNFDNFKSLTEGNLKLPAGEYFLKVTHAKGTARDEKGKVIEDKNYAMQLSMGVYRRDYDTVAQQPQAGDGIPQQSQSQIELMTMLQTQSYTDFGLSGTQKLSNALLG